MVTITNTDQPFVSATGSGSSRITGSIVEARLVSIHDRQPVEGWDTVTGEMITMLSVEAVVSSGGLISLSLWPTTLLAPGVLYRFRSRTHLFREFYASVPDVPAMTWKGLRASAIPLSVPELSAFQQHLQDSVPIIGSAPPVNPPTAFPSMYWDSVNDVWYWSSVVDGAPAWVQVTARGLKGDQGIQGDTGPQGPVGPQGPQGPAGSSSGDNVIWTDRVTGLRYKMVMDSGQFGQLEESEW